MLVRAQEEKGPPQHTVRAQYLRALRQVCRPGEHGETDTWMPLAQSQHRKATVIEWWTHCDTTVPPELWHDPNLADRQLSPHARPWRPWKPANTEDPCRRAWNSLPTRVPWSDPGIPRSSNHSAPTRAPPPRLMTTPRSSRRHMIWLTKLIFIDPKRN